MRQMPRHSAVVNCLRARRSETYTAFLPSHMRQRRVAATLLAARATAVAIIAAPLR